jgi:uncharacterized RDD family membrane protein YckC
MSQDHKHLTKLERGLQRLLDPRTVTPFPNKKRHWPYASFNDRVMASFIDIIWSYALFLPVFQHLQQTIYGAELNAYLGPLTMDTVLTRIIERWTSQEFITETLIIYCIMAFLTLALWTYSSTTPGKWILRMRIVDAQTFMKPTNQQFVRRYLGYIMAFLPLGLGFAWIALDKRKQGVHDKFADTLVVKVKHWRIKDTGDKPHIDPELLREAGIPVRTPVGDEADEDEDEIVQGDDGSVEEHDPTESESDEKPKSP